MRNTNAFSPAPRPEPDRLLTRSEVAARLDITPRSLDRWVAAGRFPGPRRNGRRWSRWDARDVEAFLERLVPKREP